MILGIAAKRLQLITHYCGNCLWFWTSTPMKSMIREGEPRISYNEIQKNFAVCYNAYYCRELYYNYKEKRRQERCLFRRKKRKKVKSWGSRYCRGRTDAQTLKKKLISLLDSLIREIMSWQDACISLVTVYGYRKLCPLIGTYPEKEVRNMRQLQEYKKLFYHIRPYEPTLWSRRW